MALYQDKIIYGEDIMKTGTTTLISYGTYQIDLDGKNKTKLLDTEMYHVEYVGDSYLYIRPFDYTFQIADTGYDGGIWKLTISGNKATMKQVAKQTYSYGTDDDGFSYIKSCTSPYVWNGKIYYIKCSLTGGATWGRWTYWVYRYKADQTKEILVKWKYVYGTWTNNYVGLYGGGGNFWVMGNYFYCLRYNAKDEVYFCRYNVKTNTRENICKLEGDSESMAGGMDLVYEKDGKMVFVAAKVNETAHILTIDVNTGECVKNL